MSHDLLELMEDYDLDVQNHAGKANAVADALSRKSQINLTSIITSETHLLEEMPTMNLYVGASHEFALETSSRLMGNSAKAGTSAVASIILAAVEVRPELHEQTRTTQQEDSKCQKFRRHYESNADSPFQLREDSILRFHDRVCVPIESKLERVDSVRST